ncbi:MAG TPA: SLC13 family permease [Thermoanaerobaculia bacterium]|nr:SLC13 family permease [Thermoanaerobaculia bacterium]
MIRFARERVLELIAAALAAFFLLTGRVTPRAAARAIDLDLLLVLFALLIAVEIVRASGYLDLAVAGTVARFHTTRGFALALMAMTGALACLITNDVTLFVVIPFTVVASRFSDFDVEDAVILEIIAANLLGCLTPLGNPQNLFIFHQSGWSAAHFVAVMAPFVACSAAGLLAALFLLGPSRKLEKTDLHLPPRDGRMAVSGALCLALVLLEIARVVNAWPAAIAALIAGAVFLRRRALEIDFSIVPLFFFAFIVIAGLPVIRVTSLFWAAVALSQVISNVPATVLLSPFAHGDWRTLLYGVNAGGCGTIIASLANLLGWRLYMRESNRDRRFFWRLTAVNAAFLLWVVVTSYFYRARL